MLLVAYYTVKIERSSLIRAVFFFFIAVITCLLFFYPLLTMKAWSYVFAAMSIVWQAVAIMQYLRGAIS